MLANALADDGEDGELARRELRAAGELAGPDRVDVETLAVLRRRWLAHTLSDARFAIAIDALERLDLERVPALRLLRRAGDLRANVTAYDAVYVALAEALGCALLTADARLARAPGLRCPVLLLG